MPADFGLVAMVTGITGLGQAFADLGLSEATIQREDISHEQVSTLFWINVAMGLALTLASAALAPVLVWFYRDPRLANITLLLSLTFLVGGLRVQHDALLRRQMRFTSIAIRDVVSVMIGVPVAITMAWKGAGYWAIVALPLAVNSTQVALSWLMVRWLPGPPRRDPQMRTLISFGGNVAASYLLLNIWRGADNVLIGRYWGADAVGLYSRAYNLLLLPARQLSIPVGSVAIPAFSRVQGDAERFARYFLRTLNLMVWITAPLFGFLFVAAEPIIVVVLGAKWRGAAPVFKVLVISALAQVLYGAIIWLFVSRGRSTALLRNTAVVVPILISGYVIGLPFDITGVALVGSLFLVALVPWILTVAFRGTALTLLQVGRTILYPTLLSLIGIAVAEGALHLMVPHRIVSQLLIVGVGFAVACGVVSLIRPARHEVMSLTRLFQELRSPARV